MINREDYLEPNCPICRQHGTKVPAQMDMQVVYDHLDSLYGSGQFQSAGDFLMDCLSATEETGDVTGQLLVINELLGYNRQYGNPTDNIKYFDLIPDLIYRSGFSSSLDAGITLVNMATARLAIKDTDNAIANFAEASRIYADNIPTDDSRFAALYNNMAGAYLQAGRMDMSETCYLRALRILEKGNFRPDLAVTYVNLASLYNQVNMEDERVHTMAEKAIALLEQHKNLEDSYFCYSCRKVADPLAHLGYFKVAQEYRNLGLDDTLT